MKQSELDYKQETGLVPQYGFLTCPDCGESLIDDDLYKQEYVEWLEEKYEHYLKCQQDLLEVSEVSQYDWDSAVNQIGQLQDQLSDAIDEIRNLSR